MTLEQLRIFVAVAEREHVTQGARNINLTQSATSASIIALEARYATKLFDRVGRRIALTEAGRLFLVEAKAVLARAAAAETVLADLAGLKRGSLTLAASQTVANYWLPRFIHRYQSSYPGIALRLSVGNTQVSVMVHEGTADLGFIEGEIDNPALSINPVAEDELVLVVSPDHPWAKHRPDPASALKSGRWIFREHGSGTRSIFEAALLKSQDLEIALELPSNEAVRAAVEAGAGVAVISKLVVASSLKAGSLVAVDIELTPEPIKDWSLTTLREKLIKIGAKVVSHGRYVAFQMAEVAIPRNLFVDILRLIAELRPPPVSVLVSQIFNRQALTEDITDNGQTKTVTTGAVIETAQEITLTQDAARLSTPGYVLVSKDQHLPARVRAGQQRPAPAPLRRRGPNRRAALDAREGLPGGGPPPHPGG